MPANTPHVGVRTFLQTTEKQPFIIADMSTIGGAFTPGTGTGANAINRTHFPADAPVHFTTDDDVMVAGCGSGTLRDTVDAAISEGIVASIVAVVPDIVAADDSIDEQMAKIVGTPSGKTGLWALLDAEAETGVAPDLLIAPGFTSQRLGSSANPAATALDALCERIITAVGICDVPSTNKTDAVEWAADFTDTMNLIAIGQSVRVYQGETIVTRPASPHVAALIAKTDKARGAPYYNPGNQPLIGILGPNRPVGYAISDPDSEANYLIQRGVNSLVQINKDRTSRKTNSPQGKTFWGFVNTSTDPLWRAINVVRTRKAVREVVPRTLVEYIGKNLGVHLVTVILQSLEDFLSELKGLPEPAILGGEVKWDRNLNSNATMRVGGLNVTLNFEEAPPLLDLGIYTGRYEHAFDILADEIEAAMAQYNVRGALTDTTV